MSERHEGGCLCGQVRYAFSGDPLLVAVCHCRNCQKQSGAPFSLVVAVADDAFSRTGQTRVFDDQGDSGAVVHRHFCPECGSPIVSIADALPGLTLIKAGTFDSSCDWPPAFEVYCDRASPWLPPLAPERHALNAPAPEN
ncbi:MAG: GFA family protein [Pseudomonadota bacterium]